MSTPDWNTIKDFIVTMGWTKGVFTIFFFMTHGWVYILYNGRVKDRQKEIERLAADNREYRERFLKILDEHYDYKKPKMKGRGR